MILTPKEKAKELVQRFTKIESFHIHERVVFMPLPEAKQCALIAVDLLLYYSESPEAYIEFEEIKQEIELL
jgi:hypothetical protein